MEAGCKFSVAILAGGQSRRFGQDKTLAAINGRSLTSILADGLSGLSDDTMVICKNPGKFSDLNNVRLLADVYDKQCPLVGIITALLNSKYEKVFVVSADTPFVQRKLVEYMSLKDGDAVLPKTNNKIHTLTGFYSKCLLTNLKKQYFKGNYRIIDMMDEIDVSYVDEEECRQLDENMLSFININTKKDYKDAVEILKKIGYTL
ncbi:Molybdopterin-guanine dinucleotide biosynthesis protein A [Flexistipes sinusarabici DSM 4947]|uniref:Probable molybdenum cofactor guanylyltransferase n=1 Tax=Flexistipes sinusarabici (strain ATCC 49648 / DSM 4947 / MAS 10) TaxID=717231 RepID=F8E6F0_FLESM|nr:molybdenum cofactor guanylyltransferase [Flexistipes sinusarabici]AEI14787.1 Molybdopterin-guanine dinucleotide biosynthesis protein A [Flexistipes sinusarabici DSM 4947]